MNGQRVACIPQARAHTHTHKYDSIYRSASQQRRLIYGDFDPSLPSRPQTDLWKDVQASTTRWSMCAMSLFPLQDGRADRRTDSEGKRTWLSCEKIKSAFQKANHSSGNMMVKEIGMRGGWNLWGKEWDQSERSGEKTAYTFNRREKQKEEKVKRWDIMKNEKDMREQRLVQTWEQSEKPVWTLIRWQSSIQQTFVLFILSDL